MIYLLLILQPDGTLRSSPLIFAAWVEADKRAQEVAKNQKLVCWIAGIDDPRKSIQANDAAYSPTKTRETLQLIKGGS